MICLSVQDDLCDYMIGLVEDDEAALISGEV